MKILHTADLHLGRQFMGLSLEEDHEVILDQILETLVVESADVLVIAGDVFDRASPPNSSIRQFNRFLKRLSEETDAAVVMISGNHDSGDRIGQCRSSPLHHGYLFAGLPTPSKLHLCCAMNMARSLFRAALFL